MNNKKRLEFIKQNYFNNRAISLLPKEKQEEALLLYANSLLEIVPKKLYKYRICNDNNLNILREKKAWFSNPSTWNDPLDVTVSYDIEKDLQYIKENIDKIAINMAFHFINQYIESFCEQKKFLIADVVKKVYYSAFKGENEFNPTRMIRYLTPVVGNVPARQITVKTQEVLLQVCNSKFKDDLEKQLENMMSFNKIKDNLLMYSLSETYTNNHQWAMYADGGKGFCIGYEIVPKNKKELSMIPSLLPIYYGKKKPLLVTRFMEESLEYTIRQEGIEDLISQEAESLFISFNTKDKQWSGEEEWRFSLPAYQCESNKVNFDFAKNIYLGENIDDYWKNQLIDIAKEQKLKVYQRMLDSTKSKWIYKKITIN